MKPPDTLTPDGALLFVRYAFPPNALGYCGPIDSTAFRQYGEAGIVDDGLVELAKAFAGAWPYLELIAGGCGIADPLDRRVVEAYWVGNGLLDAIPLAQIASSLEDRFRPRVGRQFTDLVEGVLAGGVPHHSFHVFGVYPWVGLLGDDRKAGHALTVLDRCRIRWGEVVDQQGGEVTVRSRPLMWDGRQLLVGEPRLEVVQCHVGGTAPELAPGDWVSMHWHWVCDRLTHGQLKALRHFTRRHLDLVNRHVVRPAALVELGAG